MYFCSSFCQITDRFFQAITGEELQIHLLTILVDSLLEPRDVHAGNAVKTTISSVSYRITIYNLFMIYIVSQIIEI